MSAESVQQERTATIRLFLFTSERDVKASNSIVDKWICGLAKHLDTVFCRERWISNIYFIAAREKRGSIFHIYDASIRGCGFEQDEYGKRVLEAVERYRDPLIDLKVICEARKKTKYVGPRIRWNEYPELSDEEIRVLRGMNTSNIMPEDDGIMMYVLSKYGSTDVEIHPHNYTLKSNNCFEMGGSSGVIALIHKYLPEARIHIWGYQIDTPYGRRKWKIPDDIAHALSHEYLHMILGRFIGKVACFGLDRLLNLKNENSEESRFKQFYEMWLA